MNRHVILLSGQTTASHEERPKDQFIMDCCAAGLHPYLARCATHKKDLPSAKGLDKNLIFPYTKNNRTYSLQEDIFMICPYCHQPIKIENAKFCPQCGGNLTAANKETRSNPHVNNQAPHPIAYCKNCGAPLIKAVHSCPKCGVRIGVGKHYCQNCGNPVDPKACICVKCGCDLQRTPYFVEQKSKLLAGLLGIFLGGLGIHNFYLGYYDKAIIQLVITLIGVPFLLLVVGIFMIMGMSIWGLVEGILILTGSIDKDARGIPLIY